MEIQIPPGAGTYRYWEAPNLIEGHVVDFTVRRAKWADFARQAAGEAGLVEVLGRYPNQVAARTAIAQFRAADG